MKFLVFLFFVPVNALWAEENRSYLCRTIQHAQVLRSVTTVLDPFEFEVVLTDSKVQLNDRFFYGASELSVIKSDGRSDWTAEDLVNRLRKQGIYLYISRLDGVGVKAISASCDEKPKF
tara:strand:+ start:199 stop:555 length:357 start_codon:yes stop_codon:yes gene_type:complete